MNRFSDCSVLRVCLPIIVFSAVLRSNVLAQGPPSGSAVARPAESQMADSVGLPTEYLIGPEDVLGVLFWREQDLSSDVTVRPDGIITLPVIGDIKAAGKHPQALRDEIRKAAEKYVAEPNVTVVVRQLNS